MKKLIPLMFVVMAVLSSCDSPRSQRSKSALTNSLNGKGNITAVNLDNANSSTIPLASTATPSSVVPSDASHCKFSTDGVTGFESVSSNLGEYTLCQSSTDKNTAYFQLKTPSSNVSICVIPTTNAGSNSMYVGNAMCGTYNDPKTVRKLNFIKIYPYENATITGVMVFKDLSWLYPIYYKKAYGTTYSPVYNNYINTLDAYKLCMNMILEINNSINCTYFKNVGQYLYKQF